MGKIFLDTARILAIISMACIKHEDAGNGEEKAAAVSAEVMHIIAEKKGIDIPAWAVPIVEMFLPSLINYAVKRLNGLDLLGKLKN